MDEGAPFPWDVDRNVMAIYISCVRQLLGACYEVQTDSYRGIWKKVG
jgi:hypothetical protein